MNKCFIVFALSCVALVSAKNRLLYDVCFPLVQHFLTTEDGYILSVFRFNLTGSDVTPNDQVVLLSHGLGGNINAFLALKEKSIGCKLAESGFDVWFVNHRGNDFSRNHTTLSPDDPAFWDFNYLQMGIYDDKAVIDYMLETTEKEQINFICHSAGCAYILVLLSIHPEYNSIIRTSQMMAPTIFAGTTTNVGRKVLSFLGSVAVVTGVFGLLGQYEFNYDVSTMPFTVPEFPVTQQECLDNSPYKWICNSTYFLTYGWDSLHFDGATTQEFDDYVNSGTSWQAEAHLGEIQSQIFQQRFNYFNFGLKNFQKYGTLIQSPEFQLSNVNVSLHVYYGGKDDLVNEQGVQILSSRIPQTTVRRIDSYSHLDFLLDAAAYDDLYIHMADVVRNG